MILDLLKSDTKTVSKTVAKTVSEKPKKQEYSDIPVEWSIHTITDISGKKFYVVDSFTSDDKNIRKKWGCNAISQAKNLILKSQDNVVAFKDKAGFTFYGYKTKKTAEARLKSLPTVISQSDVQDIIASHRAKKAHS